ncbi:MAG TPA: acetate kinase [Candidatus Aminicenantes bacterium]|nr:acetate kinase [Candidatus Aminicenantes bacterium]
MKILVINSGSSSIKFKLISMRERDVLAGGVLERIGIKGSRLNLHQDRRKQLVERPVKNHEEGINLIIEYLTHSKTGVLNDRKEISAVGHRVVHAGEKFHRTVLIDDLVMSALRECIPLAPLHNPPNITGIEACRRILEGVPNAAVFDTAFHQTMSPHAYVYPVPYTYYEEYGIRRYGFHGTSHYYVARQAALKFAKPLNTLNIITCHLGNGSSITAVEKGRSVDTSMGFTPLEGLMMGTRCGDIDPAIPLYIMRNQGIGVEEMDRILNKHSGLQGVSQLSSDMRDVHTRADEGDPHAGLALDILIHRIRKYLGAYMAVMNGADIVVFTAGIGENDTSLRERVLERMDFLGIRLDRERNAVVKGAFGIISATGSPVTVMVVPTNEELEIAEQTMKVVRAKKTDTASDMTRPE